MKFAKFILTGAGAIVLAGLILTLLAPKAAHAIAATAIQVMNTSTSPVPVDEDNSARHAFTLQCEGYAQFCWTNLAPSTGISVVDFVYISSWNDPSGINYGVAGLNTTLGGQNQYISIPLTLNANSLNAKSSAYTAVMPIKLYIDNNSRIMIDCLNTGSCRLTAVGHTVTP